MTPIRKQNSNNSLHSTLLSSIHMEEQSSFSSDAQPNIKNKESKK